MLLMTLAGFTFVFNVMSCALGVSSSVLLTHIGTNSGTHLTIGIVDP